MDTSKLSQLRKGSLEMAILALLTQRKMYGYQISQKLAKLKLLVVHGTLYPLLSRLTREGLLSYEWVESPEGPPRKYYLTTHKGAAALENLNKEWRLLSRVIEQITNQKE